MINPVESLEPDPEPLPPPVIEPTITKIALPAIHSNPEPIEKAPEFHDYVEKMPAPVGGFDAFYEFISKNMNYPSRARHLHIEGKVFVQFVVDENGKITDIKVIKGVGSGLDKEAERVLSISPDWLPGRQGGRRVKVRMVIPITFKLN